MKNIEKVKCTNLILQMIHEYKIGLEIESEEITVYELYGVMTGQAKHSHFPYFQHGSFYEALKAASLYARSLKEEA